MSSWAEWGGAGKEQIVLSFVGDADDARPSRRGRRPTPLHLPLATRGPASRPPNPSYHPLLPFSPSLPHHPFFLPPTLFFVPRPEAPIPRRACSRRVGGSSREAAEMLTRRDVRVIISALSAAGAVAAVVHVTRRRKRAQALEEQRKRSQEVSSTRPHCRSGEKRTAEQWKRPGACCYAAGQASRADRALPGHHRSLDGPSSGILRALRVWPCPAGPRRGHPHDRSREVPKQER